MNPSELEVYNQNVEFDQAAIEKIEVHINGLSDIIDEYKLHELPLFVKLAAMTTDINVACGMKDIGKLDPLLKVGALLSIMSLRVMDKQDLRTAMDSNMSLAVVPADADEVSYTLGSEKIPVSVVNVS